MTKQFAVIGNPIEQSRSPELHHAFAAKTGVDLNYKKFLHRWMALKIRQRIFLSKAVLE